MTNQKSVFDQAAFLCIGAGGTLLALLRAKCFASLSLIGGN